MKIPLEDLFSGPIYILHDEYDEIKIAFATKELAEDYRKDRPEPNLYIKSIFVYTESPPVEQLPRFITNLCLEDGCIKAIYGTHEHSAGCPDWPRKVK
jgi:hypothetical protein